MILGRLVMRSGMISGHQVHRMPDRPLWTPVQLRSARHQELKHVQDKSPPAARLLVVAAAGDLPTAPPSHSERFSVGKSEQFSVGIDTCRSSSPRARGTVQLDPRRLPSIRFIPVCTGNSRGACGPSSRRSVHPRVHGEQDDPAQQEILGSGSSPCARGTDRL